MKQVSGVTGAAPLWARIMLHLHQDKQLLALLPPKGMVKLPVCALSGLKPTPACPSVVEEYFALEDLAYYHQHPDNFYQINNGKLSLNLPSEYNQWLAQNKANSGYLKGSTLKILSPASGDYYVMNYPGQKLELQTIGGENKQLEWYLNGEKIATGTGSSLFWAMRPGNWNLEVRKTGENSGENARVNFEVTLGQKKSYKQGFSLVRK
jgi:penicillin-binding protein 1C